MTQPGSAYSLDKQEQNPESHTISVLVDNEPGVLARVIGLFSGRGYNIESLTVSETEHEAHLSRITIVTTGTPMVIEQIKHQLDRLVPIHSVTDLTVLGQPIERELGGSRRLVWPRRFTPRSSTRPPSISSLRSPASSRASRNSSP
jgi:acetolactate synthase-1/3 small subunit